MADDKKRYRSYEWFGKPDRDSMVHRSWMKNQGLPHHLFDGRPVIGICNTYSEVTPCNAHFREIAERVKRGVLEAGGFPLEFPVMSLGELEKRRREWKAPPAHDVRSYVRLYCDQRESSRQGGRYGFPGGRQRCPYPEGVSLTGAFFGW